MKTVSIRFDDSVAQPAIEAARSLNMSFNEFVQRAVMEKVTAQNDEVLRRARENMRRYASVMDYLAKH